MTSHEYEKLSMDYQLAQSRLHILWEVKIKVQNGANQLSEIFKIEALKSQTCSTK